MASDRYGRAAFSKNGTEGLKSCGTNFGEAHYASIDPNLSDDSGLFISQEFVLCPSGKSLPSSTTNKIGVLRHQYRHRRYQGHHRNRFTIGERGISVGEM